MVNATMTSTTTQPMMSVPATTHSDIMPSCPTFPTYIQPRPSPERSASTSSPSSSAHQHQHHDERRVQNRIRFALFIKVLLKLIEDKKLIRDQTKSIVKSYVKKNKQTRNGGVMEEDMELPLRGLVGDDTWLCARHYTQLYFQQKSKRKSAFPPSPTLKSSTENLPHSVSMSSTTSTAAAAAAAAAPSTSTSTSTLLTAASAATNTTKGAAVEEAVASTASETAADTLLNREEEPQDQQEEPDMITSNSRASSSTSNIISVSGEDDVNDASSSSSSSSEDGGDTTIIQEDFLKGYDEYNDYMLNSPSSSNHRRPSFASRPLPDSLMTLLSLPPMKLIPSTSNHDDSNDENVMEEDGGCCCDSNQQQQHHQEEEVDGAMDTSSQRSRSSSIESFYVDDIPGSDALDELPSVFQQQHHQENSNENFPSWLTDEFLLVHPAQQQHQDQHKTQE